MTKAQMQDVIREALEKEHKLDERCITSYEWREIFLYLDECFDAVSMSVIEDIKAEIREETECHYGDKCLGANCPSNTDCMIMGEHAIWIIDKHISGRERVNEMC